MQKKTLSWARDNLSNIATTYYGLCDTLNTKYVCPSESKLSLDTVQHRRRIKREAKAKVFAAVWGTEFIQFLAAILHLDDF